MVGAGAVARGRVERAVVWPGAVVEADEVVLDAIRYPGGTVAATGPARSSMGCPASPEPRSSQL